jgi:hypothetical protein
MKAITQQRPVRQMPPDAALNNKGPPDAEKKTFLRILGPVKDLYSTFYTDTASKRSDGLRNNLCRRVSNTVTWGDFTGRAGMLMNAGRRWGK